MKISPILRVMGYIIVLVVTGFFFTNELQKHWDQLVYFHLNIKLIYLAGGVVLVALSYLLGTLAWRETLFFSNGNRLKFSESVSLVNVNQLAKYLPGKVWAFAFQMYWASTRGISKTLVLTINVIMVFSSILSAALLVSAYLIFEGSILPHDLSIVCFALTLAAYLAMFFGGTFSINLLIRIVNKLFNRQLQQIDISLRGLILVHSLYMVSNLAFGLAGYTVAIGIGVAPNVSLIFPIVAAMLCSETIGFLAIFVPGGIGVREGIMYIMLKSVVDIQTCFVLPVAIRLVTTLCDLIVGGIALVLLKKIKKEMKHVT